MEIQIKDEESKPDEKVSKPVKSRSTSVYTETTPHNSTQLSIEDFTRSNSLPKKEIFFPPQRGNLLHSAPKQFHQNPIKNKLG